MSTTNTPTSIQRALGQGTPSDSASHCLLDNVDIMNSMPTLGNLIDHSVAPTIIAQASAPTPRLDRYPRRRSTQQKPILQLQLRPQVKAFRSTSKRSDRRRSRTYWPVWYQKQRRREYKEAVRNMKLDELRRLELMELWEEEWFQTIMNYLTDHLKRVVLTLARELRRQLERLDEMELERLDDMEDLD